MIANRDDILAGLSFHSTSYQHVITFQRSKGTISHVVKREPYKHYSHV